MITTDKMVQKERVWSYLKASFPLIIISLISCGMSIYYLRLNPDHLLGFDDSYITLRFASNLFKYRGITYDGVSYLAGATSPLHIIFVALAGLFLTLETASLVIGIVFFVFSSILVYLWTLRIYGDRKIALLAGVMTSTSVFLISDSLNGLETTTFIFFSLLTFYLFYVYESKVLYVIPLFLSVLTRPEGWFIAGAIWLWQIIQCVTQKDKKIVRHLIMSLGIFILLITPYVLLSLYCTGSLLPSTAFAKAIFFAEAGFPLHDRIDIFRKGFCIFINYLFSTPLFILPLILFSRKLISLPYLWFYYIVFYLFYFLLFPGALKHYWCRYQHIFIPIGIIAISGGVLEVIKLCKRKTLQILVAVFIVSLLIYNQSGSYRYLKSGYTSSTANIKNTMIDLALWLKRNTPRNSLIVLHDIGVVGYFSDRKIIDLVGLTNPEVSRYYWNRNSMRLFSLSERRVIDYLKEKKPDYLVMFPSWDRFFNFFQSDNGKHFKHVYTSNPLFPTGERYKVFKCDWEL